ncbi:hypothetical protein F5144DRAFT_608574 [Chaetomium tenue]|uniref:Uncharacterized protein n=1 Tax=Chaetomium tenue TaxID=1854479 RepID=A0ACB7PQM6_9PEZI|nr:hypothetical protein F5144DRAFT_608574 [Chaetomium globosum]
MSTTPTATTTVATEPVGGNLSGSPIIFYPLPTPWPAPIGCEKYLYRQTDEGTILAWDPVYPSRFQIEEARRCFSRQLGDWWWQDRTGKLPLQTAFGPTFVCPEAYTAVHTSTLDSSVSAAQTAFTYCCPSNYALGAVFQPTQRHVMQCTSVVMPGETLSYMSRTSVTRTVTVSGTSEKATVQSTNIATSTVVKSSRAIVYAVPINGFNIVHQQGSGTGPGNGTATPPLSTTDTPLKSNSPSMTPGAIAGVAVGAALGTGLLALGAFFIWKVWERRKLNRKGVATLEEGAGKDNHYVKASGPKYEMPVKHHIHELSHFKTTQELP